MSLIDSDVKAIADAMNGFALDSPSPEDLARAIREAYPRESLGTLRRAMLFAVADPERRDHQNISKLHDAAMILLREAIDKRVDAPAGSGIPAERTGDK